MLRIAEAEIRSSLQRREVDEAVLENLWRGQVHKEVLLIW